MKILLMGPLPQKATWGGAERHFSGLVSALCNHTDLELEVLTVTKSKESIVRPDCNREIKIHQIISPSLPATITGWSYDLIAVTKAIKKINPDLVHAQMLEAPYGLAAAVVSKRYPTVITAHSYPPLDYSFKRKDWKAFVHDAIWTKLIEFQARKVHKLISVSDYLKEILVRYYDSKKITVIPNGVDDFFFAERFPQKNNLLFIGRIMPVKGLDFMLESLGLLKKEGIDFYLKIAGSVVDNVYFNSLVELTESLGIRQNVEFLPPVGNEDLLSLYAKSDIFVLPSRSESLPMVILEAMAMGLPVVATGVGDVPTLVSDGINGKLVDFGDKKAMALAISKLLNNADIAERISVNARKKAEQFRWKQVAEKTMEVYRSSIINV